MEALAVFKLYDYMRDLLASEEIFLEPSACAAFQGPIRFMNSDACINYMKENGLEDKMSKVCHIAWATGGRLVPEKMREEYKNTYL